MSRITTLAVLALLCCVLSPPTRAQHTVETDTLRLTFGPEGELLAATLCHPGCTTRDARRIALGGSLPVVAFTNSTPGRWSMTRDDLPNGHRLTFSGPEGRKVAWEVPEVGYGIELATDGLGAVVVQTGEDLRPRPAAGFGNWLEQVRYVAIRSDGARQIGLDDSDVPVVRSEWAGVRSRFWAVLISAERSSRFELATGAAETPPRVSRGDPGGPQNLLLYLGPVEPRALDAVDPLLQKMLYAGLWFWLRWICFALFWLLTWLHGLVPVWGVAIMLLSVTVGFLMSPLSRAADRVQQSVHATEARLAPELARIKQNYRGEEQAAKIIALYKTERVHPLYSLKSLLGVAIVIPVFIGAFDMLAENIHLMNTGFLWIGDLSRPDAFARMPFELPFFGSAFNLLPLLMTGLSIAASWLHRPLAQHPTLRRRQLRNMILLAVVFFVLFYTFPAGMVLYWTTNNLVSVGKGLWSRLGPPVAAS